MSNLIKSSDSHLSLTAFARLRHWVQKSIANRAVFAASVFAMLMVIFLALSSIPVIYSQISANNDEKALNQAQRLQEYFQFKVDAVSDSLTALSKNSFVVNAFIDSDGREIYLQPLLRDFQIPFGMVGSVVVLDLNAKPIASNHRNDLVPPVGIEMARQVLTSGKFTVRTDESAEVVLLAAPVYFPPSASYVGVVLLQISPLEFFSATSRYTDGDRCYSLTSEDRVVYRSDCQHEFLPSGTSQHVLKLGAGDKAFSLAFKDFGSSVGVPMARILFAYLFCALLGASLAMWFTRKYLRDLTQPLIDISNVAQEISNDPASKALAPATGEDEVGKLGRAFNSMVVQLRDLRDDLEERVRIATKDLLDAKQQAERANAAKSVFLANMSHEIRTPLNAVLGMHRMLQGTDLKPGQSDLLGKANQAGLGLMDIINDVLDLAKIEAGEMSMNARPFQPRQLFEELMDIHGVVAQAKGLKLTLEIAADLPLWIVGDRFRLRQVLSNLLSNAIKFTTSGAVTLLTHVRRDASQPWIELVVRDSGVGISQDAIGRLFTPFVQADESTTRQFGGTGLGLSIVRNLARMMGGDARVSSTLGVGSEFLITLPLVEADEHLVAQAARASRPIEVALMCADEDLCRDMRQRLTALGWLCFRPMTAETGEADVLLMDAALGNEGAVRLREMVDASSAQGHELPAILLGDAQELVAMQRLALPLHRVVQKPADMSRIFNSVVEVLALGEDSQDRLIGTTRAIDGGIHWLQDARILVVDDSEINLEVAVALLRQQGAACHTCANGQEAVDWLMAHPDEVDAVLMDVQMPVLDGLAATRLIKSFPAFKSLPVIALTAGALDSERLRAKAAGMDDCVFRRM